MRKIHAIVSSALFILVITLLLIIYSPREEKNSKVSFTKENKEIMIDVEVADSVLERTIGLMNRSDLSEDAGMLFIFPDQAVRSFWMKNTLIPLDIMFISEGFEIVHIEHSAQPCYKDPCGFYNSVYPAKYAVEVNGGFVKKNEIRVGDMVKIY